MNLESVWKRGLNGSGVLLSVVDDGVQYDHPDFSGKFVANASWDFNVNGPNPLPGDANDAHGTRCAGVAAAAANDFCGVGVAYGSHLAGRFFPFLADPAHSRASSYILYSRPAPGRSDHRNSGGRRAFVPIGHGGRLLQFMGPKRQRPYY